MVQAFSKGASTKPSPLLFRPLSKDPFQLLIPPALFLLLRGLCIVGR